MAKRPQTPRGRRGAKSPDKIGDRPTLKVKCTFGGIGYPGGPTCSIGIKFACERDGGGRAPNVLSDMDLRAFILQSRCDMTMLVGESDEELLIKDSQYKINATGDFHGASVTRDTITMRISFDAESIDIDELAHFAKQQGMIILARNGDAGEEPAGEAAVGDDDE